MKSLATNSDDDEGIGMDEDDELGANAAPPRAYGPERPPHMRQYGDFQNVEWGFGALDDTRDNRADSDAEMLLSNVRDNHGYDRNDEDDDAGSTVAELDMDNENRFEEDHRMPDLVDKETMNAHWNDNEDSFTLGESWDYEDDHAMYSDAHGHDALHLPDAGGMGEESDPPVTDIKLDDQAEVD